MHRKARKQRSPRGVSGYILQDVQTGAAAYMIDGGLAGGMGEKCEPSPEPVPEWVKVLFISLVLIAFMAWIASTLGTGGILTPAFAKVLLMVTAGSFTLYAGNAYAGGLKTACCTVKPVPHIGGDPIHNACADFLPPNDYPGMAARVDGINFDAVSGGGEVLWEIKTNNLAASNAFVQMMILSRMRVELEEEQRTAFQCGYGFSLGAGDPAIIAAMLGTVAAAQPAPPGTCIQPPN